MMKTRPICLFLILSLIASICLLMSLFQGDVLINSDSTLSRQILLLIRLPHALTAFVTGGLLALAGAMMQVLVRNPLADPYILGVSSGAALLYLICLLLGLGGYWVTGGAWAGGLLAIFLVFILNKQKMHSSQQLLLTGIALASGFSACVSLILVASPDPMLRSLFFWLIGDFTNTQIPWLPGIILIGGLIFSLSMARELNLLVRGEKEAKSLGVNTKNLYLKLYLLSALLTACAVTLAGCIGFVGLIVPHLFRLLFGYDHRILLPGCVLLGGSLLTLADMFSRIVFFPQEIPVGIIMTLIGAPIFLFLLQKKST